MCATDGAVGALTGVRINSLVGHRNGFSFAAEHTTVVNGGYACKTTVPWHELVTRAFVEKPQAALRP